jgi:predicted nuclease with TOPRIM domain
MRNEETTLDDVLDAVNKGFSGMQAQFEGLRGEFYGLRGEFGVLRGEFEGLSGKFDGLDRRLTRVETLMVTKDYLDEKLAPIRGKINVLVDVLHQNRTLSDDQRHIVHSQTS